MARIELRQTTIYFVDRIHVGGENVEAVITRRLRVGIGDGDLTYEDTRERQDHCCNVEQQSDRSERPYSVALPGGLTEF